MKVLNLHGVGDLRLEERPIPEIGDNEVLVKIRACGICSSDEERIFKKGTYHFPTVPGHEFAGVIVKTGKNVDKTLLRSKVSIFPLLPCFKCDSCMRRHYATCSNYKYFGSRNDGGFSEYLAVPEWNINLLDDSISFEVGALSEPAAVAYHSVEAASISAGDNVAIIGTGAIGILIAGFCKLKGSHPVVVGRREESISMVQSYGIDAMSSSEISEMASRVNIDSVFEAVGSNNAMALAIGIVKPNGTIIAVGNPKEDFFLPKDIYWKILRKQISLRGTWNSSFKGDQDDWEKVALIMKEHRFPFEKLITARYPIDQYRDAFEHLLDKSNPKSRIVITMNGDEIDG